MKDEEILKKAIEQAIKNGFRHTEHSKWIYVNLLTAKDACKKEFYISIIFSHDFAKAFFGFRDSKSISSYYDGSGKKLEDWEYHLQQMVLCENPLQYLQQFLKQEIKVKRKEVFIGYCYSLKELFYRPDDPSSQKFFPSLAGEIPSYDRSGIYKKVKITIEEI